MRFYSNPERESDPHALSDLEVFYLPNDEARDLLDNNNQPVDDDDKDCEGWYWWVCYPGCLPDSPLYGPFESLDKALENAREGVDD